MDAFRYVDGALVVCPYTQEAVRLPVLPTQEELRARLHARPPYNANERRRWARAGTRGRRGARRIPAPSPPPKFSAQPMYVELRRHLFADASRAAALYLPAGAEPTERDTLALDRVMRERHGPPLPRRLPVGAR